MNWKLLFVFCLTVALLVEVDAASRDRKKKKNRNQNDDDDEETTGGSVMGEEQTKKDDNKDGGREREREEKEKEKKKESESSSEEDEEKKNGTEVEIPKVNGGEKLALAKKPIMETSSRFKREHHVEPRKGLILHNKNFEATDLLQGLPTADTILQQGPTINLEDLIRKKRDHHEGNDKVPKSQTHARQGLAAAGEQRQEVSLPKSQTHARQGHAANLENQKKEVKKREANEAVPEETYGDPIATTPENQVADSEKREKRDSDDEEIGPKVASTPMSLNNPANPEGAAVFTEIINTPQMRKRRQIITENGQLYDAHPNEEHAVLEELIFPTKRAQKMKRETELKRDAEVNGGEQLKLGQSHAKAHTHARQGHAANPDNHQH